MTIKRLGRNKIRRIPNKKSIEFSQSVVDDIELRQDDTRTAIPQPTTACFNPYNVDGEIHSVDGNHSVGAVESAANAVWTALVDPEHVRTYTQKKEVMTADELRKQPVKYKVDTIDRNRIKEIILSATNEDWLDVLSSSGIANLDSDFTEGWVAARAPDTLSKKAEAKIRMLHLMNVPDWYKAIYAVLKPGEIAWLDAIFAKSEILPLTAKIEALEIIRSHSDGAGIH